MRVKRYVVNSMPDALQQIRGDLGKDAVILNTKEIRSGGFLGMFTKRQIEVIAATDSTQANVAKTNAGVVRKEIAKPAAVQSLFDATDDQFPFETPIERSKPATEALVPIMTNAAVERSTHGESVLHEEVRQMKRMLEKLAVHTGGAIKPEGLVRLEQEMQRHELLPNLIEELTESIQNQAGEQLEQATDTEMVAWARHWFMSKYSQIPNSPLSTGVRRIHFYGPTGVGKTTTIAKLAAEQVIKHKRRVGMVTADTYRIAAVEQLKTYSTILNIPLQVIHSSQDFKRVFEEWKEKDVIFMDTAGRNFRNEMHVSELNSLLHGSEEGESYLVLSLTMKYSDMRAVTENFSKYKLDKVLFTKLDETATLGPIFNLLHEFPLQLSYVAHGQNVPDDIERFNLEQMVDRMLGAIHD